MQRRCARSMQSCQGWQSSVVYLPCKRQDLHNNKCPPDNALLVTKSNNVSMCECKKPSNRSRMKPTQKQ
eukprot:4129407-Amphidinium_carterae.1